MPLHPLNACWLPAALTALIKTTPCRNAFSSLGYVVLRDQIRETSPLRFLEQGVDLRVISGDDPRTVSGIRERGSSSCRSLVDATTLHTEADIKLQLPEVPRI